MKSLDIFIKEMQEQRANIKKRMIIDDIFDIASGRFNTYDRYVKYKQNMIDSIREAIERQISIEEGKCIFTYYIEPSILSEDDFNYIISKYRR